LKIEDTAIVIPSKMTPMTHARARPDNNNPRHRDLPNPSCHDSTHLSDLIHPNADGVNIELQAAVQTMMDAEVPENSRRAALPKMEEFFDFCDYVYAHQPSPRHLTPDKAYRFISGKETSRRRLGAGVVGRFDREEYNRLVQFSFTPCAGDVVSNIPQPINPIGVTTFNQNKFVF
jgi:hypothetical protein